MNNIPFLFTVLLSVFAWTINQIVSDLEKQPIIEITNVQYNASSKELAYLLTNVSNNKLFQDLTFELYGGITSCSDKQEVILGPPNMKSVDTKPARCNGSDAVEFTVNEFHPNSSIRLLAVVELKETYENSALYVKSNQAIKISPYSLQTSLIKNKFSVLMVLFALWFILIVVYLCCVKRNWLNAST
ncbi:hypothetical protein QNE82_004579 [Vibrio alginolyticus]|nr:hypothetical protein [Vibrio alginolyticus]